MDDTRVDHGAYKNWASGEPNNHVGWYSSNRAGEDCAMMRTDGRWNDEECYQTYYYICMYKNA